MALERVLFLNSNDVANTIASKMIVQCPMLLGSIPFVALPEYVEVLEVGEELPKIDSF